MLARSAALLLGALGLAACALPGEDTGSTDDALVETSKVGIRLAAFIPCGAVDSFGLFDGDNRSFSYDGASISSRIMLDAVVDPDGPDAVTPHGFASKKYDGSAEQSKQGWCATLKSGARPTKTAYADLSRVTATVKDLPDSQGYAVTRVTLEAHAKNPLVFFAPNADATITLDIFYVREGGKKKPRYVNYAGSHDAFPSWELYVDKIPVFQYDVLREGGGPLDLVPGAGEQVRGQCARATTGPLWSCRAS